MDMAINQFGSVRINDNRTSNYQKEMETARQVGNSLDSAESEYLAALQSGDNSKIARATLNYDRAKRMYASFMELMKGAHELMMRLISKMS